MTVKDLAALISRRLVAQAMKQPDPVRFMAKALVRLQSITTEDALIQLGAEYNILAPMGPVN